MFLQHAWIIQTECFLVWRNTFSKNSKQIRATFFPMVALEDIWLIDNLMIFFFDTTIKKNIWKVVFIRLFSKIQLLYAGSCNHCKWELSLFYSWLVRNYDNSYINHLCKARLWNSLPIEYFPLINDLNGLRSRINRYLLSVGSFETNFLYALILLYNIFM